MRGGIAIVSKHPIEHMKQLIFRDDCAWDRGVNKGLAYVQILLANDKIHVIGTHTQYAASKSLHTGGAVFPCSEAKPGFDIGWQERQSQFREISGFIARQQIPRNEMVVIAGDMNVSHSTQEFNEMLQLLNAAGPTELTGHYATYDPFSNSLIDEKWRQRGMRRLDYVLFDKSHRQPGAWYNHGLQPKPDGCIGSESNDYSDHYPVAASTVRLGPSVKPTATYHVALRTGSQKTFGFQEAGTDSDVKIKLHGSTFASAWIPLDTEGRNDFEANQTDEFQFPLEDLGVLEQIEIYKDDSGPGPDWYLSEVTITANNKRYSWSAGKWIKAKGTTFLPLTTQ